MCSRRGLQRNSGVKSGCSGGNNPPVVQVRARPELEGARQALEGCARAGSSSGKMFAEERPPPKKIFTPDGKYEFVEDGALGTGACGVVRIAKHLETGELYAIKIMSVTGRLSEFVKEMTAYGKVTGHPNVVSFHESQVDLDKKRVYLIMVCSSPAGPSLRCLPPSPGRLLSGVGVPCLAGAVPRRRALRPHRRVGQDGGGRRTPLLWPG